MVGVAVGLGNVWRFPYMVGRFGGAAFVAVYVLAVLAIGIPALITEWTLGRHTRRGPVGAFAAGGLPLGRAVGWFFFIVVTAATAYYTNVVGWVLFYALSEVAHAVGVTLDASAILPPVTGLSWRSLLLQAGCTALVILACVFVLLKGLRSGIERASRVLIPLLFIILLVLIARAVTLPGAGAGLAWYLGNVSFGDITPRVMVAAVGQAVFSLSLGGTFMVVYGSYLTADTHLPRYAAWTAVGDMSAGLLAGLAIFPAVFALGMEPTSGPGLVFETLPATFARIPAGWLFALLFFVGLMGAAYLSDVAAFEVLVAGLTDNTRLARRRAVWLLAGVVFLCAVPPMVNLAIFVPWDLTFGSGMQTLGALLAALTVGWAMSRTAVLAEIARAEGDRLAAILYWWLKYVIPVGLLAVGVWWLSTEVLGVARAVS